jgi:hypothetical protein
VNAIADLCGMPTIEELEEYFNSVEIPHTIRFDRGTTWNNVPAHVKEYIDLIKLKGLGQYTTQPRFDRLIQLKNYLSEKAG